MEPAVIDSILSVSTSPLCMGYLDPGTGAMIISAIVGIFATIAMGVKSIWYRITGIFRKKTDAQK